MCWVLAKKPSHSQQETVGGWEARRRQQQHWDMENLWNNDFYWGPK